jgi:hypothetical protein
MYCLIGTTISVAAEGDFLCVAGKSVGFEFNENSKEWDYAHFNVADKKYLVKKQSNGWQWIRFGEVGTLGIQCSEMDQAGYIICHDGPRNLTLFPKSLRFQIVSPDGYIGGFAAIGVDGTPYIEIGTCSPL